MLGCDIRLVFIIPPKRQYTAVQKNAYTSEIIFLALVPWFNQTPILRLFMTFFIYKFIQILIKLLKLNKSLIYLKYCKCT